MSSAIETTSILRLASTHRLQWEASQQSYVLLYPEGMVKLSETAAEIFKRIDGMRDLEAIVSSLQAIYAEANIRPEIVEFLNTVYERGWITIVDK